jgi:hypothetical protein
VTSPGFIPGSPRVTLLSVVAVLVVVVYLLIFAPWRPYGGKSLETLRANFCGALPVGTTGDKAIAFLDARNVKHSRLLAQDHAIHASLGNTGWTVFFDCSTEMKLTFRRRSLVGL